MRNKMSQNTWLQSAEINRIDTKDRARSPLSNPVLQLFLCCLNKIHVGVLVIFLLLFSLQSPNIPLIQAARM